MPSSPEALLLKQIYEETGRVFPTVSYPLSKYTLSELANKLADETEAATVRSRIGNYLNFLNYNPGEIGLGVSTKLSYEHYFRTAQEWVDLYRLYLEPNPLFDLMLSYFKDNVAGFVIESQIRREYRGFPENSFPVSFENNPFAIEKHFISKGYLWYNFGPLQLEFGRNKIHLRPLRSSLLPFSKLPFMDMLRLKLLLGNLYMDLIISTLENRQAVHDVDPGEGFEFKNNLIISAIHRFEYNFRFLRLGVTGHCVYARGKTPLCWEIFFPCLAGTNRTLRQIIYAWYSMRTWCLFPSSGSCFSMGWTI